MTEEGEDFTAFMQALNSVTIALCRKIAGDGEGATKLLECKVTGAADHGHCQDRCQERHLLQPAESRHVRCGRQLGSGAVRHRLQRRGRGREQGGRGLLSARRAPWPSAKTVRDLNFSEEKAKQVLLEKEIEILVELNSGDAAATAWGCDLTYDYVKINGDYRT